jgi:hypothetical protein
MPRPRPFKGFQQPKRRRGIRSLPRDIRSRVGECNTPGEQHLSTISAIALDQDVEQLTGELCDTAVRALGRHPVPEELQHVVADWRREKRRGGVDLATLELAAKRAREQLSVGESLPA